MPRLPPCPVIYELNTIAWLAELLPPGGGAGHLATVPEPVWDGIAALGVHAVWLMGVWERSPAGLAVALDNDDWRRVPSRAARCDRCRTTSPRPTACGATVSTNGLAAPRGSGSRVSALARRGVSPLLDFVPNHVARDHAWVMAHPEWFIAGRDEDLAREPDAFFRSEDRVIACGRDPYFRGVVRRRAGERLLSGLRAATSTRSATSPPMPTASAATWRCCCSGCVRATWGDAPGGGRGRFWPTMIGGVRRARPAFTFIAEAYWDREWELQQQGFDYCYDKRLYDRLSRLARAVRDHLRAAPTTRTPDPLRREPRRAQGGRRVRPRALARRGGRRGGPSRARLVHQGQLEGRPGRGCPFFSHVGPTNPWTRRYRRFTSRCCARSATRSSATARGGCSMHSGWPDNDSCQPLDRVQLGSRRRAPRGRRELRGYPIAGTGVASVGRHDAGALAHHRCAERRPVRARSRRRCGARALRRSRGVVRPTG